MAGRSDRSSSSVSSPVGSVTVPRASPRQTRDMWVFGIVALVIIIIAAFLYTQMLSNSVSGLVPDFDLDIPDIIPDWSFDELDFDFADSSDADWLLIPGLGAIPTFGLLKGKTGDAGGKTIGKLGDRRTKGGGGVIRKMGK